MMKDFLRAYFPHARADVLQPMAEAFPAAREKYKITENSLALAMGQVKVESGGLTVFTENLHYSAPRLVEIFGVGHNSAAVTQAEAVRLAGNPQKIAMRVYGTGKKARDLGNKTPLEGWTYRGGGPLQITGHAMYDLLSHKTGVDFIGRRNCDDIRNPLYFWDAIFGFFAVKGALAALNVTVSAASITHITKVVNGGTTELNERIAATKEAVNLIAKCKALEVELTATRLMEDGDTTPIVPDDQAPTLIAASDVNSDAALTNSARLDNPGDAVLASYGDNDNPHVRDLQQAFVGLNYWSGSADGDFGVLTRDALFSFQANNGFDVESALRVKHMQRLRTAAPRILPDARVSATASTPALQQSFTIRAAKWLKGGAVSALTAVGISASPDDSWSSLIGKGFTNKDTLHNVFDPVVNVLGSANCIRLVLAAGAIGIFVLASALIRERVKQHTSGASLHR
jgi:putative chitinase